MDSIIIIIIIIVENWVRDVNHQYFHLNFECVSHYCQSNGSGLLTPFELSHLVGDTVTDGSWRIVGFGLNLHEGKGERAFGQYATVTYGGVDVKLYKLLTS